MVAEQYELIILVILLKKTEVFIDKKLAHSFDHVKYKFFRRANGSDSSLMYENWMSFPESGELDMKGFNGAIVRGRIQQKHEYSDVHASVEPLNRVASSEKPINSDKTPHPNVFILGIDSVSRSNVIRNLPLFYRYLTEHVGGWDFRGYAKIDDNTLPNMLAVLSGHKVAVDYKELNENVQTDFVDDWPFIWKNFSRAGYTTLLAEEQPGIFSYKARGFKLAPTDVYLRPFGHVLMEMPLYRSSSHYCFGNTPEAQILLETVHRFMEVQADKNQPYFAFSFLWKLSHDFTSYIERLDAILTQWLQQVHTSGLFNNTVVMVMSDHGNRFDDIRKTLIGRYEERMPFLFVHLPEDFTAHEHIMDAMNKNVWRLTTQFDVYETLVDIVHGSNGGIGQNRFGAQMVRQ
uniref:Sulfatase N-terminal domain-containing protein n=1 Tax=Parascaris univalens TaxID=6257 RepID=A0A915BM31_PARUN